MITSLSGTVGRGRGRKVGGLSSTGGAIVGRGRGRRGGSLIGGLAVVRGRKVVLNGPLVGASVTGLVVGSVISSGGLRVGDVGGPLTGGAIVGLGWKVGGRGRAVGMEGVGRPLIGGVTVVLGRRVVGDLTGGRVAGLLVVASVITSFSSSSIVV